MAEIHRPALGQEVAIGTLYDAKRDQFLPSSVLPLPVPGGIVSKFPCPTQQQHEITWSVGATHKERFTLLGIDSNLAASIACDLIVPQGSGMFLKDGTSQTDILQGNVRHIYNTSMECLDLKEPDFLDILAQGTISSTDRYSTYVVLGINYGLQNIITMKYHLKDPNNRANAEAIVHQDVITVHEIAKSLHSLDFSDNTVNRRLALEYEFRLYTDIQEEYGIYMPSLALLCTFVQKCPQQVGAGAGQKGYPITYTLLPLQVLNAIALGTHEIPNFFRPNHVTVDIQPVLDIFDRFNEGKERLDDYKLLIQAKKQYIPLEHIDGVDNAIIRLSGAQNNVKVELKRRILNIRNGIKDDNDLHDICEKVGSEPEKISLIAGQQSDKINFTTQAVDHGASYIGFNGLSLKDITLHHESPTPYTFEFNNAVLKGSRSWKEQHDAFMEFLLNPQRRCQVYIIDCDAPTERKHLDCARFSEMQRTNMVSTQYEEQSYSLSEQKEPVRQRRSRKCIARYPREALDLSTTHELMERHLVRIPCPGKSCDSQRGRKWSCAECDAYIGWCYEDENLYCDCGRAPCDTWRFKCDGDSHGRDFDRPSSMDLDRCPKRSPRPLYRNIMVLGETGVGKSTFINAFYNFLKFESFDEAKTMSKRNLEYTTRLKSFRVGSRDDERDGIGGDSATHKTSVYTMRYRNTTYRLFNTPGIGDTRGPEQDKENLRGIMNRLRDYEELHGPHFNSALKNFYRGIERDDETTCHESWDKSRAEALRFLQHVDRLKPHDVGQTPNMDGVAQAIKDNIELLDKDVKELQDARLTGGKLRKKLHLQRIEFTAEKLDKPRTVCRNSKCCDLKTNPNGEVVTDYKSVCHRDCKLPNVTEDSPGHLGLADCRAFKKDKMTCSNEKCGHHWQEHVHILYELKERKVQVKDTEVERRLKANTNDITVRQEGIRKIKDIQREYEEEREQLRTAMVRFVAYLKEHAITAVNDRTVNYYTELIRNEKNKIQRAKDRKMNVDFNIKKLKGLKQDLAAHLELTETIKHNMRAPRDSSDKLLTKEGVRKLIQDLYNLPHFGKDLQKMKIDIVSSHETNDGERSHRRQRSRGRKDVASGQDVEDRDGPGPGPSNRREREFSGRRGLTREDRSWLPFWRSSKDQSNGER
ncbi:hypothetical protein FLAG1_06240 [Fusarium langsethiae]|uniref:G domain-containing protein n=1 Tax=Fusarium langsethiae TaxID=179993 RepID=A0A0M9EW44_FUSLA|nr:hypothetical protein FLAG1_06240 [Fusarium langsethiae]